jgi:hypothetical protein
MTLENEPPSREQSKTMMARRIGVDIAASRPGTPGGHFRDHSPFDGLACGDRNVTFAVCQP